MDASRFDALTKAVSVTRSRRTALGALLAATLSRLGMSEILARPRTDRQAVTGEGPCGNGSAKANACTRHRQCCTRFCRKRKGSEGRCRCRKLGQSCQESRNCCASGGQPAICQSGTCHAACGACTATQICASGACQPCDVCPSGCTFTSVQAAVAAASPGATIRICAGTYVGNVLIDRTLSVIGAGDGNDPVANTILQGTGAGSVVSITDAASMVTLQSLRITGGQSVNGAGIFNDAATLIVSHSTVSGNTATDAGGGIYNGGGCTLTLIDSTVSGNTAAAVGGGLHIHVSGTLTLTNSTVSGNTAGGFGGGGIFTQFASTSTLTNSTITGNTATAAGGGLHISNSTLDLIDSDITANTADLVGGGIYTFGSDAKVTFDAASRVTGNAADPNDPDSGGGIFNSSGTVTLNNAANVTNNTPDNCNDGGVPMCVD